MSGGEGLARHTAALAFGAVIREIRIARGLSQEALADRGGFDRTYPSLLERGLRMPTIGTIVRLAQALGVSAESLVADACERLQSTRVEGG